MPKKKIFDVSIYFDLHAVTCPGVWLCPKGKVAVKVAMFGVSDFTKQLSPYFPLLFHERFHFQKIFKNPNGLQELHKCFSKLRVSLELLQFPEGTTANMKLAEFSASISDILTPCPRSGGTDLDLLFCPKKCFPGIIAPKAEVSTKISVVEKDIGEISDGTSFPTTITSKDQPTSGRIQDDPIIRQKAVCHTKHNLYCGCFRDCKDARFMKLLQEELQAENMTKRSIRKRRKSRNQKELRTKKCSCCNYEVIQPSALVNMSLTLVFNAVGKPVISTLPEPPFHKVNFYNPQIGLINVCPERPTSAAHELSHRNHGDQAPLIHSRKGRSMIRPCDCELCSRYRNVLNRAGTGFHLCCPSEPPPSQEYRSEENNKKKEEIFRSSKSSDKGLSERTTEKDLSSSSTSGPTKETYKSNTCCCLCCPMKRYPRRRHSYHKKDDDSSANVDIKAVQTPQIQSIKSQPISQPLPSTTSNTNNNNNNNKHYVCICSRASFDEGEGNATTDASTKRQVFYSNLCKTYETLYLKKLSSSSLN